MKRPSALGAKLSLVVGAVVWFLWGMFVYTKYSVVFNVCEPMFGKITLWPGALDMDRPAVHRHALGHHRPRHRHLDRPGQEEGAGDGPGGIGARTW